MYHVAPVGGWYIAEKSARNGGAEWGRSGGRTGHAPDAVHEAKRHRVRVPRDVELCPAFQLHLVDLDVRERRPERGRPVHQPLAAAEQALVVLSGPRRSPPR